MSGMIIPIIGVRTFDYGELDVGKQLIEVVRASVDVANYTEASLLVRVHPGTNIGANASISMLVGVNCRSEEEPNRADVFSKIVASATVDSSHAAPALIKTDIPVNFGEKLIVAIQVTQNSSAAVALVGVLSAGLVVKGRDA